MKKLSIKLYLVFYCTMIGLATSCITPYEPDVEWINVSIRRNAPFTL